MEREFSKIAPHINLEIGLEPNHPEKVVCAMVWNQPKGALTPFKNLKLIFAMGAGVDHILKDETIPKHIPICRVIDYQMAFSMSNYILMAVLNYHRSFYEFQDAQSKKHWSQFEFIERPIKVGVLGIGHLGMMQQKKFITWASLFLDIQIVKKKLTLKLTTETNLMNFLEQINVLMHCPIHSQDTCPF